MTVSLILIPEQTTPAVRVSAENITGLAIVHCLSEDVKEFQAQEGSGEKRSAT